MAVQELIEAEDDTGGIVGRAMDIATTREAQGVQAAMIVAKKFPRDEDAATARILKACKRVSLAERALYEYKRGNGLVTGPSIRLAEVMAQAWGNLDCGVVELERKPGESVAMAFCWDLETNTRVHKIFTVRHIRDTKGGGYALRDERDIYELVANNGARRLRACILGIIPGDIQDLAREQITKTLTGDSKEPITDRVRKMLASFDELGVTQEDIERRLQHPTRSITPTELVALGRVHNSIRDGFSTREQEFPRADDKATANGDLNEQIANAKKAKPKPESSSQPATPDKPKGNLQAAAKALGACGDTAQEIIAARDALLRDFAWTPEESDKLAIWADERLAGK